MKNIVMPNKVYRFIKTKKINTKLISNDEEEINSYFKFSWNF